MQQYEDNLRWLDGAGKNKLVVGSQARILYSDQEGRAAIARAFNEAVASGEIKAPIVISRDHHDVSGTDSPFRETSNIKDGIRLQVAGIAKVVVRVQATLNFKDLDRYQSYQSLATKSFAQKKWFALIILHCFV